MNAGIHIRIRRVVLCPFFAIIKTSHRKLNLWNYMLVNTIERDARNDGWKAGLAEGEVRGSHQAKLETARILKQLGDSITKIMQVTGLTEEEVEIIHL